jgi:hypothetical protein
MEKIIRSRATILGSIEEVDGHPMLRVAVGRVPLNSAAAAILSLCDSSREPEQIVASIVTQHRAGSLPKMREVSSKRLSSSVGSIPDSSAGSNQAFQLARQSFAPDPLAAPSNRVGQCE